MTKEKTSTPSTSEKEIQRSLRNTTLARAIGVFFFMIVREGPIPLLLEKLGASGIAIGLSVTLLQLGMLAQIPTAFYTERLTHRKHLWVTTTTLARAAIALPALYLLLAPTHHTPIIYTTLLAIATFSILFQAGVPSCFSWMADLIPENIRSKFWSKRQGYALSAAFLSVAFTGWFLDQFPETSLAGFGWILLIATLLGILDGLIHGRVQEPKQTPINPSLTAKSRILKPLQNREFLHFTLAMCA